MQKQFEQYLLAKNYSPLTSIDYPSRLERLCRKEKFSYEHLAQHLDEIMPQYEKEFKRNFKKISFFFRFSFNIFAKLAVFRR